ncbi:Acetyltransferase (GNAT) family protein [Paenibacillus sp. 1_12]|uniref:GNAT family N-acetyltransferase n=1 Tax=Paenibacillus sp. 1_12 TaxID=1566278 RepID=UPI0008F190AC|nr:GNAT family N-acetyltransferase [Paenibacillus sp. 1_12]SFM53455.1 Acetyltransferase (GNAT) family protein [Paenibacillus sp. 1_12]
MTITIRFAHHDDYNDVSNLVRQIHQLHVTARPDIYSPDPNPMDSDYFLKLLEEDRFQVIVVEDKEVGKIIAYSVIRMDASPHRPIFTSRKYIFIDDFCVDENERGQGIGKELFNFIISYGKEISATCIELSVSEFNKEAIAFYENLGMQTRSRKLELNIE